MKMVVILMLMVVINICPSCRDSSAKQFLNSVLMFMRETKKAQRDRQTDRQTDGDKERQNSNSKIVILKDSGLNSRSLPFYEHK